MRARELGSVLKQTVKQSIDDDVTGLAAQAAFSFAFSLFPTMMLIIAVVGLLGQTQAFHDFMHEYLSTFLPTDTMAIIESYIHTLDLQNPQGLISISILLTLWTASGVVAAYIKAVNRAYDAPEDHPFLRKRLISLAILALSGLLVLLGFVAMVFGPVAGEIISDYFGVSEFYRVLIDNVRFPVALIFISVAFALLYRVGPNVPHRWYEIVPGAVLATWFWITVTFSFSLYVEQFGRYNTTYGSLGGFIVLLTWMFLTSLTIIVGAEFNAAFGRWIRNEIPRTTK